MLSILSRMILRLRTLRSTALLFLAGTTAALLPDATRAAPADAVFTVGNYPVEARADNAVAAKERALADGQQAAFRSLLKRLVPVTAHARLRTLKVAKPGDMINGIRVRAERNSPTDYLASLDFSFQPQAVRNLLQREGLPFVEEQAPALILIPVWRAAPGTPPKDEPAWTNAWKSLDLDHALAPVKLQTLGPKLQVDSVAALASGDGSAMRSLVAATGSELVVVALGEPDPATKKLNVTLSGRDAVGAFTLKRAYRLDPGDPSYASELAGVVSMGILEGRWKAVALAKGAGPQAGVQPQPEAQPPPGAMPMPPQRSAAQPGAEPGSQLQVAVQFRGMNEWQDIVRRLTAISGIQNLDVAGLSARGARVTFRYAAGTDQLTDALDEQGLSLRNSGGAWLLSAK